MENICQTGVMTRKYLIRNSLTSQTPPPPKPQISLIHFLDFINRIPSDSPSYGIKWHLIDQHRRRMRNDAHSVVKSASCGCIYPGEAQRGTARKVAKEPRCPVLGESAQILANSKESAVCRVQQAGRLEGERKWRSVVTHSSVNGSVRRTVPLCWEVVSNVLSISSGLVSILRGPRAEAAHLHSRRPPPVTITSAPLQGEPWLPDSPHLGMEAQQRNNTPNSSVKSKKRIKNHSIHVPSYIFSLQSHSSFSARDRSIRFVSLLFERPPAR